MGKYIREAKMFLCNKVFLLIVGLTAACSYGFAITYSYIKECEEYIIVKIGK